jgi:purine-binding chemotaxis protein CheW
MEQLCIFEVAKLLVGIDIRSIQEILRVQPVTVVPLAPSTVRGLMSLRGQIVPVVDLRVRLGLPASGSETAGFNVIVRTSQGAVSLLVDEVGDVVEVGPETFEPVPDTMSASARPFIRGAHRLERRLLLTIEAETVACVNLA